MLYIEPKSTDAAFHFAAEEFCMSSPGSGPIFMTWHTGKCVMLGCNQIAHAEIDVAEAEREKIQIVRRSSGGGTIFTDPGTLLFTVILPLPFDGASDAKKLERDFAAAPIVRALSQMGLDARLEGRNDIMLGCGKISGLAQYVKKNVLCTHGSLLYDADLDALSRVLRADEDKIRSKALRSARSRVTNIAFHMDVPMTFIEFWSELKKILFKSLDITEYVLTDRDIAQIETIRREKYANPDWTYGRAPRFSFRNRRRFPMGTVEVFLDISKGIVESCRIHGDFLGLVPVRALEESLEGRPYRQSDMERALGELDDPERYLGGITGEELILCLFP
ncbi:MAG: lipoate--protein ligase [Synergistaceae bacterium]|nr:lipoate--protein ligase [Synergistaceae bacterium]